MIINQQNIKTLFDGFKTNFSKGFAGTPVTYPGLSMKVPSTAAKNVYGWLGQFPRLREWVGDRVVNNLSLKGFEVPNRTFESTIVVKRTSIEDDEYGVFAPILEEMGRSAAEHPDELLFKLLASGFTTACYDGQFFFDSDHPVTNEEGQEISVSNVQAGGGPAWYLFDTSRAIKPLLFQERLPYQLQALTKDEDADVFWRDEYVYGVRARSAVAFGLWQLAYASKADLTPANYEAALTAMQSLKGDQGRPLNIVPDTLIVPASLQGKARQIVNNGTRVETIGGQSVAIANEWAGSAKLNVSPWLS